MSQKYTGGFITKSPVAPTTTAASGIWTLDQQQQAQKAGTWPSPPLFIEDMFSTFLYTGTGATQTITNGIDLSGQGGLVWEKGRSSAQFNGLVDTVRGVASCLVSSSTGGENTVAATGISAFNSNGFTQNTNGDFNTNGENYVSWTFREQPKFFDIVTYTGDGIAGRTVAHNLGAVPGCIIVKCVTQSENWYVYHQSIGNTQTLVLNQSAAKGTDPSWNNTTPTSTVFTVGSNSQVNFSGRTYIAYLFASDAGGFPVSGGGSTNGITCGSFTTGGSGKMSAPVNLGYEPQWLMVKNSGATENWVIYDTMRGMSNTGYAALNPNTSGTEYTGTSAIAPNATGFDTPNASGPFANSSTYVYIAIRRGPMKTPTVGTSVFSPLTYTGDGTSGRYISGAGFPPDLIIQTARSASENREFDDRLRGGGSTAMNALFSNSTNAEAADSGSVQLLNQDGFTVRSFGNGSSVTYIGECFRRAPSFFDVVCYTGTGSNTTQTHNLGVAPELVIIKSRSNAIVWVVGNTTIGFANYLLLNTTDASASGSNVFNSTAPTSTVFSIGAGSGTNQSGATYVAYLFATLAGVSKVGSYTGNGSSQTINCGFTGGARFVLIKRTDSTGDWWTYDSARGITAGDDPYLYLNSTAAEVTNTNYVDTDTTGFKVTAAAPAGLNANGGTYIFLAIA